MGISGEKKCWDGTERQIIHWQVTPTEGKGKEAGLDGAATRLQFRPDNFFASPVASLLAESHLAQSLALENS